MGPDRPGCSVVTHGEKAVSRQVSADCAGKMCVGRGAQFLLSLCLRQSQHLDCNSKRKVERDEKKKRGQHVPQGKKKEIWEWKSRMMRRW